jgi:hypothetical protein
MKRNWKLMGAAILLALALLAGCSGKNDGGGGNAGSGNAAGARASGGGEAAPAASVETGNESTEADFRVQLTQDSAAITITGYKGTAGRVRIPTTIEGIPVRSISGYTFRGNKTITSVIIPGGVKIEGGAFENCTNLRSVVLDPGITIIPDGLFKNCTSLTSVAIPDSVTTIDREAFWGCASLASVTIPGSVTRIGKFAFYSCTILSSVVIPDSVKMIGLRAFENCGNLVTVTISPVKRDWESESEAFDGCPKLSLASQSALRAAGYTGWF